MGTRADFYVGKGDSLRWMGSVGWDGYPDGVPAKFNLIGCSELQQWEDAVVAMLSEVESATVPDQGWPWPWDNSGTTDYAYTFDEGAVWAAKFGSGWVRIDRNTELSIELWESAGAVDFPDMTLIQNVAWDGRSGLLVLGGD